MTEQSPHEPDATGMDAGARPWPALWVLCLGFFMILVDSTIVSVATPALMHGLHADVNQVMWVTSAYLLTYAVPLLITGRLGDRFGPKNLYLAGLAVFTLSSLWCGMTDDIRQLIAARAVQGLGAALMTPQTTTVITRVFPAAKRGQAMGMWSAVASVAVLVGPLAGGALVAIGWQWIFFVNVPIGVVGFALALWLVPSLPVRSHAFDWLGMALSAIAMFLLVFAIQDGQNQHWDAATWSMIAAGIVVFGGFVLWQARNRREPLVPLGLFRDRNFALANAAIAAVGFAVIAMAFPLMLYLQDVLALSALQAALVLVPSAVISGVLAPWVGKLADRVHPRYLAGTGALAYVLALVWLAAVMQPHATIWKLELPIALLGVGNGFLWAPLGTAAIRNLPMNQAGAGSGVYNTTRQFGSVLGSAAIAVLMELRLAASGLKPGAGMAGTLPPALHAGFSAAMAESLLLPAAVMLLGVAASLCLVRMAEPKWGAASHTGE